MRINPFDTAPAVHLVELVYSLKRYVPNVDEENHAINKLLNAIFASLCYLRDTHQESFKPDDVLQYFTKDALEDLGNESRISDDCRSLIVDFLNEDKSSSEYMISESAYIRVKEVIESINETYSKIFAMDTPDVSLR